ncbi:hypothetical protein BO70DRAFT_358245 [Aspergillus heteromorphus CBS 117.55]|uniref:histone acetyltransferase n=1 Tax=Aspergillus heteromorphus CBS 117.55 TaxID=1448321 RepID=A0A317X2L7_9EURO|nr:uncharacterized protein BO70DRAFT_358245 [Aspergillus heteromorphus CBS 117.55]PWY90790.1 hypothetical protein BO70DRAFT_358245 [Aspergillus heteromorphus CBS 117.55]
MSQADVELGDLLAESLPAGVQLTIRHVSSTPSPTAALFAAPPNETPEPTFCETHFLSASITLDDRDGAEIIIYGVEVLVYSTAHLTTIFVSKADSTGHLHRLAHAPKVSILRRVSHTFLSFLVQTHQRPGVRLVVSLFARAQNQYLFPGSIENPEKHVLDDRGLIKWWCRVADPILRDCEPESGSHEKGLRDHQTESAKCSATAFLIVPGCDRFETRGFFPPTARADDPDRPRWVNSYPVQQLCDNPTAPPRCLVPRFPDDPKTRFLVDLDDELPGRRDKDKEGGEAEEGNSKSESTGQWRSVRSLEQFWEMMSFRQECSAGRLVGFLWLVINPPGLVNSVQMTSSRSVLSDGKGLADNVAQTTSGECVKIPEQADDTTSAESEKPTDPAPAVSPSHDPTEDSAPNEGIKSQPAGASAFFWPEAGRGHAVLSDADYKTAINFLIDQDFYDEDVSIASTKAWGEKVASLADQLWVGQLVVGRKTSDESSQTPVEVNTMITGLVRKRKKVDPDVEPTGSAISDEGDGNINASPGDAAATSGSEPPSGVNVLQANLIRKKKKKKT